MVDLQYMDDAEYVVVAYGTTARIALTAVRNARTGGHEGRPHPPHHGLALPGEGHCRRRCTPSRAFLTVEMSLGQMVDDVRIAVNGQCPVRFFGRTGGMIPGVREVLAINSMSMKEGLIMATVFREPQVAHGHAVPLLPRLHPRHHPPSGGRGASEEFGHGGQSIGVAPVGCAVFAYNYFNCDMYEAAHGRAPAVATGAKRVHPDKIVFTYQGDGDLASIGTAEIVHAATRGEKITVIFINNAHLRHDRRPDGPDHAASAQKTTTSPYGRTAERNGNPIRVCEMLSTLDGPGLSSRASACTTSSTS